MVSRHPGDRAREGTYRGSPLAEYVGDTCSFAGDTEDCRVGEACVARSRGRERLGDARESSRCFAGHTITE